MPEQALEYRPGTKPVDKSSARRVQYARQLCLYGNGDGKPIMDPETLARLAGIHVQTVRRHVDVWIEEREALVRKASGCELALNLSPTVIDAHEKDMTFLRDQIQQVKWETDTLDDAIEKFEGFLTKFSGGNQDEALEIFDRYCKASLNKQGLRAQFLRLQSQWTKLSGVEGMMDVGLTKAKEDAKLQAKLDARTAAAQEGVRDVTPEGLSVFKRES